MSASDRSLIFTALLELDPEFGASPVVDSAAEITRVHDAYDRRTNPAVTLWAFCVMYVDAKRSIIPATVAS